MEKRGLSRLGWILVIALVAFAIVVIIYYTSLNETCKVYSDEGNFTIWFKENILLCDKSEEGIIDKSIAWTSGILGFDRDLYDFFPDLLVGALVGAWLWIVFFVSSLERGLLRFKLFRMVYASSRLKGSWLGFIGGRIWKIIPIAVGYAVLMQIPVVNVFIGVITFEQLFNLAGRNVAIAGLLKSFILAFYLGFLPTAIQGYTRYKLKKRYEEAIIREKYRGKIVDAMARSK